MLSILCLYLAEDCLINNSVFCVNMPKLKSRPGQTSLKLVLAMHIIVVRASISERRAMDHRSGARWGPVPSLLFLVPFSPSFSPPLFLVLFPSPSAFFLPGLSVQGSPLSRTRGSGREPNGLWCIMNSRAVQVIAVYPEFFCRVERRLFTLQSVHLCLLAQIL